MTSYKKEIMTNKDDIKDAIEGMIAIVGEVVIKNDAYYKWQTKMRADYYHQQSWEKKARELTKYNRRLRLERNYIENNTEM